MTIDKSARLRDYEIDLVAIQELAVAIDKGYWIATNAQEIALIARRMLQRICRDADSHDFPPANSTAPAVFTCVRCGTTVRDVPQSVTEEA